MIAVNPKCYSTTCHWYMVSAALVTSPPVNSFQTCRLCFPGSDRPSTSLPRWRLPPDIRLRPT